MGKEGNTSSFGAWYEENRTRLSQDRREQYANNRAYRTKCLKRTRDYRKRVRTGEHIPESVEPRPYTVTVCGNAQSAWTIRYFAERINRNTKTIYAWQGQGLLPSTPFESDGGHRLYTDDMISAVEEVLLACDRESVDRGSDQFYKDVHRRWRSLGIYRASKRRTRRASSARRAA